jgi:beta-lactamase class A
MRAGCIAQDMIVLRPLQIGRGGTSTERLKTGAEQFWRLATSSASRHGTPIAVANLLQWLANGQLLSRTSSALLLEAMTKTRTYPERLQVGVPNGWLLAHETGTGRTWKGITAATNDAGILMTPDASSFVVVVFIAESNASDKDRAALIAEVAREVGECSQ